MIKGFKEFLLKNNVLAKDLKLQFGIVPPQSYRYVTERCIALLNDGCLYRNP